MTNPTGAWGMCRSRLPDQDLRRPALVAMNGRREPVLRCAPRGAFGHSLLVAFLTGNVMSLAIDRPSLAAQVVEEAATQTLAEVTATPDSTAALFLRSLRAIRWGTAARLIDDDTLDRFKTTARMMAAADVSGEVSAYLVGLDSTALPELAAAEVFERAVGTVIDDMPGLMHSIYDRDDEVLGHVREGADTAHVVYRTTARLSGAVPEVKVMQLTRAHAGGWRVIWSDELEILEAALRGVAR